jgi:hypothetical protein
VIGILLATAAAFLISLVFYAFVPVVPSSDVDTGRPRAWQVVVELLRNALTAGLVAGLMAAAGWRGPVEGMLLGLALGVLPVVLLAGSVVWERVPVRSASAHAADWLAKLSAIGAIVGVFA